MHLEGSIRPTTALDLAAAADAVLPPGLSGGRWSIDDFDDFLANYLQVVALLRHPDDFRRIAFEFCEDAASQGIRYAEVTFSVSMYGPVFDDWDGPVEWVLEGFDAGRQAFGTECRLVLDIVRNLPHELARPTLDVALRHRPQVVALGLGGDEAGHPPEGFVDEFRSAADAGLPAVPHAGEAAGADSVRTAVEQLGAVRVGHGIRVLDDPALVIELAQRHTVFEVCPTSNVFTGVVPTLAVHPLPRMVDVGLTVTLNSDDPPMFDTSLLHEYETCRTLFGFSDRQLADLVTAGIDGSFMEASARPDLHRAVGDWLDDDEIPG